MKKRIANSTTNVKANSANTLERSDEKWGKYQAEQETKSSPNKEAPTF